MVHPHTARVQTKASLIPGITLMGVWTAGLSLGLMAERFYGDCCEPLALSAGLEPLRLRDACMVAILPLLLSALAVFLFHRCGACLACILRGLSIGFFLGVLTDAGGAWLAVLLLFSGLFSCPVLLWYLWRRLMLGLREARRDMICCLLAGLVLAAVDTWVVAPFLAAALTF